MRLRAGLELFAAGEPAGVAEIVLAIEGSERRFLDDPWGAREAQEAVRALRPSGNEFGAAITATGADRDAARARLRDWAQAQVPDLAIPAAPPDAVGEFVGGLELRSCKHGDLFLRWTADGELVSGLAPIHAAKLDSEGFRELVDDLARLEGVAIHGTVVCDYLRVRTNTKSGAEVHHKLAPAAAPESMAAWLKRMAALIEKTGDEAVSRLLSDRLPQFVLPAHDK